MALPPGVNTTYDVVKAWALDAAGFGTNNEIPCPVNDDVIDTLLLNALQQVYSQVWQNRQYAQTWTFDILANAEQVATDPDIDVVFVPMYKVVERIVRTRDYKAVYEDPAMPLLGSATADENPTRLCYTIWGSKLAVTPPSTQDETYTVYGYRELSREIYTIGAGNVITWQLVDLPDEYMEIYQKIVLGFLLSACGDGQRSQYWLQVASDELNTLLNQPEKSRATQDGQALVMGGGDRALVQVPSNALVVQLPIGS